MATQPTINKSWYDVGGPQVGSLRLFWTWAQARVAVSSNNEIGPAFQFGFGLHSALYNFAPDTKGKLFRGVPFGVGASFYQEAQEHPSTDVDWYFFWGGYVENPPDSGNFVQSIYASVDNAEIGLILDGTTVVCSNTTFMADASARDPSGVGQFIGSFPADNPPGAITSMTTA
jgi:hypothetical protein